MSESDPKMREVLMDSWQMFWANEDVEGERGGEAASEGNVAGGEVGGEARGDEPRSPRQNWK